MSEKIVKEVGLAKMIFIEFNENDVMDHICDHSEDMMVVTVRPSQLSRLSLLFEQHEDLMKECNYLGFFEIPEDHDFKQWVEHYMVILRTKMDEVWKPVSGINLGGIDLGGISEN